MSSFYFIYFLVSFLDGNGDIEIYSMHTVLHVLLSPAHGQGRHAKKSLFCGDSGYQYDVAYSSDDRKAKKVCVH